MTSAGKTVADIREDRARGWTRRLRRPPVGGEHAHDRLQAAGPQVATAMLAHKIAIGRSWPSLPNHVRVTLGTREEMAKFKAAFAKVMAV